MTLYQLQILYFYLQNQNNLQNQNSNNLLNIYKIKKYTIRNLRYRLNNQKSLKKNCEIKNLKNQLLIKSADHFGG